MDKNSFIQKWVTALGSWNLKYDDFPKLEVAENIVAIGNDVFECASNAEANEVAMRFKRVMLGRSRDYWNCG